MFSILQQIKIAMSNKNDPYNYALAYHQSQLQGEQKNLIDNDSQMESILGSVVNHSELSEDLTQRQASSNQGFFNKLSNVLGFGRWDTNRENQIKWQELPWEDIIVKTNVITKWKDVDMKQIN